MSTAISLSGFFCFSLWISAMLICTPELVSLCVVHISSAYSGTSISAALNSLAACSLKDVHLIFSKKQIDDTTELKYSRLHTLGWGIFSIAVAMFATQMGSLIEAVNVLGSLFYGPILGIFLVAFYFKKINGTIVFISAILSEIVVIAVYEFDVVSFLWLNVVGAAAVIAFSTLGLLFYRPKALNS